MTCACYPQPPTRGGFCIQCGQPVCLGSLSDADVTKMKACGNCDNDQENLCNDCPCKMIPTSEPSHPRHSEAFPELIIGRIAGNGLLVVKSREPEPTPHSMVTVARMILRLKGRQDNALEIITMYDVVVKFLSGMGRTPEQVLKHPFMQYLTWLLRIRLISDSSYRQCENMIEGMAQL